LIEIYYIPSQGFELGVELGFELGFDLGFELGIELGFELGPIDISISKITNYLPSSLTLGDHQYSNLSKLAN
jgi:hypothetical protein